MALDEKENLDYTKISAGHKYEIYSECGYFLSLATRYKIKIIECAYRDTLSPGDIYGVGGFLAIDKL